MKVLYQTEWQNIDFSSFAELSSTTIAGSEFYNAFYEAVFEKYAWYESLPVDWRRDKDDLADWLAASIPNGSRVLSVVCGLGYIEQRLWELHSKRIDLHVQDYATKSLRWLRLVMPAENIHDAMGGGSQLGKFDLIYLSAVDYALEDAELVMLLSQLKDSLSPDGKIMLISASFMEESVGRDLIYLVKQFAKWLLVKLGLRSGTRGQFWGFMRTKQEYLAIMHASELVSITDDFFVTPHQCTFWIQGIGVNKE